MHADFHHFTFKQLLKVSEIELKSLVTVFANIHLHKGLILSLNTFQSAKKLSNNCNDEKGYLNCSLPHEDVAQKMEEISNSIICIVNMGFTKGISNNNICQIPQRPLIAQLFFNIVYGQLMGHLQFLEPH